MVYSLLSQCEFGWGTPRCKQNTLPSFLYNNLIIWNHKIKPLDPWVFAYKTTPEVANQMSQDQEFLELASLDYVTKHRGIKIFLLHNRKISTCFCIYQFLKLCSILFYVCH